MLYYYKGKLPNNKSEDGLIAAENENEALREVDFRAVKHAKIKSLFGLGGLEYKLFKPYKLKKLKKKDMAYFFTQLGFLMKSGVNTFDSIEILGSSININIARLCKMIKPEITQGNSLANTLDSTKLFPRDIVEKVRAGENSNSMEDTLKDISDKLKEEIELASAVRSGVAYPLFEFIACITITMFMMVYLVPKIMDIVKDFGAELPGITKALIACSDFIRSSWWIAFIVIAVILVAHTLLRKKNVDYKLKTDELLYKVPVIGKIVKKLHILYLSSIMSQLLNSGKTTADTLSLSKETTTNDYLMQTLNKVEFNIVRRGMNLYQAMENYEFFPGEYLQLIAIGVRTGNMAEVLDNIYDQYRYETTDEIKAATSLITPISLIFLGVMVAFIVIGMYGAIYCIY